MGKSIACFVLAATVATMAQSRPGYLLFTDPGKRFSIEFPNTWTWMIIQGSQEPLATFVHPRKEAAVVVERFKLPVRLNPGDITDLFAEIEAAKVKENQRDVSAVVARIVTRADLKGAVVDYVRGGLSESERVRQFSIPVGDDVYRITCMALASRFQQYELEFEIVASTLKYASQLP